MDIGGHVEPGFEALRDAFAANFDRHGDVGAAFCVYHQGRPVVDIWGGLADQKTAAAWEEDTLTLVFSSTKGVTAVMAHRLAEQGRLDLDAPVSTYWPEFGSAGKEAITTRDLLSHRAGLPAFDERMNQAEALKWTPAVDALAAQAPMWEPGTRHGYHAVTYGWLVGEVIRRVTGSTPGTHLREEIAGPLELDLWIGLPEELEARVSRLITGALPSRDEIAQLPPEQVQRLMAMADPDSLAMRALNVTDPPFSFNSREVHAAELPAANGITTARSLAKLYAATVGDIDGIRLIDDATVESATIEQSSGPDAVLGVDTRFGSGFFLDSPFSPLLSPRSFGHAGAGGSLAFADPEANVSFAYVMNQMQQALAGDPRTLDLISALRRSLDNLK
jgi:CubicO group peptidase (beta-lactamase class C family)